MTDRITPEMVEEAVRKNGDVRLVCRTWADYEGDVPGRCACAISQILISRGTTFEDVMVFGNFDLDESAPMVADKTGLHPDYVHGFVHGFDGSRPNKCRTELETMGYEDGIECRIKLQPTKIGDY